MSNFGVAASFIGTVIVLVAGLASAYVVFKSKVKVQTVELWEEHARALQVRLDALEADNVKCNAKCSLLEQANRTIVDAIAVNLGPIQHRELVDKLNAIGRLR